MLVTVLLIDEKYIHELNIVHKTTPKIILADIILRRYDYLIKNLSREVKFGLGLVKYCKKKLRAIRRINWFILIVEVAAQVPTVIQRTAARAEI